MIRAMNARDVPLLSPAERRRLLGRANALALVTIFYNVLEGLVSIGFGLQDETLALFGFGVDSFVEVISGVGIWHMLRRLRAHAGGEVPDRFERDALRVTGSAFYLLAAGLAATAAVSFARGGAPESTFWGTVISLVSIVTMWLLIRLKLSVGRALGSAALLADAACTRACLQLSFVLLAASLGYRLTGIGGLDAAGALGIAVLALREGRESFVKARGGSCSCAKC
jgi:divalent metal cation (Fe/Co/Zn/Cd) transporter